jgi:purine-binding chemotaxis protein CheW
MNTNASRQVAHVAVAAEPAQFLTFLLGDETFAIDILSIKEIIEFRNLTTVPLMPECVRGVLNLRGAVVPVLDLQARFSRPVSLVGKRTCIVIVELNTVHGRQVVGVLVDAVNEVLDIAHDAIESPPAFGSRIRADFIRGIGKVDEKFVILLDVDQVFSVDELAALVDAGADLTV